jgi:hypothetical protein
MAQEDLNQTAASAEVLSFLTAAASIDTEGSLRAISASAINAVAQVRDTQLSA